MAVTSVYAALAGLLYLGLSALVIRERARTRRLFGDGDIPALARAIRVHGNFAEYAPLTLLLIGMAEFNGAPRWSVHAMGISLLLGRAAHAWGLWGSEEESRPRFWGMVLTFMALLAAALANLPPVAP